MGDKLVKRFYSAFDVGEWNRLTKNPYNRLEFDTSMHFLRKYLPQKGLVLDAGGGPGRYTVELGNLGLEMVLLDLTPRMLEIAEEKIREAGVEDNVRQILEGSVEDLSIFDSCSFDAVLCLGGPLSHLVDKDRRIKAARELVRVAKPGAPVFVSVIGRLALCMNSIVFLWPEMKENLEVYRRYTSTGQYFGGVGFAPCHFYLPEELKEEFEEEAEVLEMVGLEGIFSTHEDRYNEVYAMGEYNELLWETHLETCTHPGIVGVSEHIMLICRK